MTEPAKDSAVTIWVKRSIFAGLVITLLCTFYTWDWSGMISPEGLLLIFGAVFILAFIIAPYCLLLVCNRTLRDNTVAQVVLLAASLLTTAAYVYIFWTVFFFNDTPDAQDGIVLVILPIYLLVFNGMMYGLAWLARKFLG